MNECNWYYLMAMPSRLSHAIDLTSFLWHICQMMPLKVWPNTALSCNHQSICNFACPSDRLYVQLLWYPMYYPGGIKARGSPVPWSNPYSILAPTQDSNPVVGFKIISGDHYTTTAHTVCSGSVVVTGVLDHRNKIKYTKNESYLTLTDFSEHSYPPGYSFRRIQISTLADLSEITLKRTSANWWKKKYIKALRTLTRVFQRHSLQNDSKLLENRIIDAQNCKNR